MIKNQAPPFWKIIHRAFPHASLEKQIFAFYPHIYSATPLSKDLIVHEETHLKQQGSFLGAMSWWARYIKDRRFRANQELEAYRAQYQYAKKVLDRNKLAKFLDELAGNLASPVYGNCIHKEDAKLFIKA